MNKFHNNIRRLCAVLVGLVFFVAGLLKLMDPTGSALVVQEYLRFFHIGFLSGGAKGIALLLNLAETLLGAALIAGVWRGASGFIALVMVAFYTVLTLILVIFNPPMDCGCFGEAIHLTHLQTFLKNVVLCVLVLIAYLPVRDYGKPRKGRIVGFALATLFTLAFSFYMLNRLPLIDYTDYKPGTELYGADGNFAEDAPHVSLRDDAGDYYDELATIGRVLLVTIYDPAGIDAAEWDRIKALADESFAAGFNPLVLLNAADLSGVPMELSTNAYLSDYRTLIGMNRANGGVTYLEDGLVIAKWRLSDNISPEELSAEDSTQVMMEEKTRGRLRFQGLGIFLMAVLVLL